MLKYHLIVLLETVNTSKRHLHNSISNSLQTIMRPTRNLYLNNNRKVGFFQILFLTTFREILTVISKLNCRNFLEQ